MDTINSAIELATKLRNKDNNNNQEKIETLLAFIASRAVDTIHENNADLIADFIEKFIVVELKRFEKPKQINTVKFTTEYADGRKETRIDSFNDGLHGKGKTSIIINWLREKRFSTQQREKLSLKGMNNDGLHGTGKTSIVKPVSEKLDSSVSGNGHASTKTRKLYDDERDFIRTRFIELNGEFDDKKKYASELLETLGTDISVWQITGFVSALHREIAAGEMIVPNMPSYLSFLSNHRRMWARYNSIKYKNLRADNEKANMGTEIV